MTMSNTPLLEVQDLSFGFTKGQPILASVSFSIPKESFTLLCGPNGSGKSLLLKCIKGLLEQTGGKILLDGIEMKAKQRMHQVGLVFQDSDTQIVGQTVERDIRFGMENLDLGQNEQTRRLDDVLALLDLGRQRNQRPRTLSGGEKRRLSIAGVLVMDPKLLILDEPFANLDYRSVVSVIKTLLDLQQKGHTIVLVSHEVDKVLSHVDQALILERGVIVSKGTAEELLPSFADHGIFIPPNAKVEDLTWLKG